MIVLGPHCCMGFSLVVASGDYSIVDFSLSTAWTSHCSGFTYGSQAIGHMGFNSCSFWAVKHRLNNCDAWAQLLWGKWDLSGSGIKTVSPALAGGFFYHWATREAQLIILDLLRLTFSETQSVGPAVCGLIKPPGDLDAVVFNGRITWGAWKKSLQLCSPGHPR